MNFGKYQVNWLSISEIDFDATNRQKWLLRHSIVLMCLLKKCTNLIENSFCAIPLLFSGRRKPFLKNHYVLRCLGKLIGFRKSQRIHKNFPFDVLRGESHEALKNVINSDWVKMYYCAIIENYALLCNKKYFVCCII